MCHKQHLYLVFRKTIAIAFCIARSWSVIIPLGVLLFMYSNHVLNDQTNVFVSSFETKPQPSRVDSPWWFTPTNGAKRHIVLVSQVYGVKSHDIAKFLIRFSTSVICPKHIFQPTLFIQVQTKKKKKKTTNWDYVLASSKNMLVLRQCLLRQVLNTTLSQWNFCNPPQHMSCYQNSLPLLQLN